MREQESFPTEIITVKEEKVKLFEDKKALEEFLVRIDPFIIARVDNGYYWLPEYKREEIKQNARIKLWQALSKRAIVYPRAYISIIIVNEFNNLGRGRKQPEQLLLDEHGELHQGTLVVYPSDGWGNPEQVVVQREELEDCLDITVQAILTLPARQQIAFVCLLVQHIDDVVQLKRIFEEYEVPIWLEDWPDDAVEKQRLKALISVARRKVIQFLEKNASQSERDVVGISFFIAEHVKID